MANKSLGELLYFCKECWDKDCADMPRLAMAPMGGEPCYVCGKTVQSNGTVAWSNENHPKNMPLDQDDVFLKLAISWFAAAGIMFLVAELL